MGAYGIPGDPAGMRELARTLRTQAQTVTREAGHAGGRVDRMVFEGPAADSLKLAMLLWRLETIGVTSELERLAGVLERSADRVEEEQEDARREAERREREAREAVGDVR